MLFVNRKFLNSLLHFLPLHWETAWQQHCSQGNGLWPTHDWDGREFSHNHHPRWFRLGGSELCGGWRGVMDGVQGDQDFLHKIFQFKRHLDWLVMCFFWFYSLWPWIPFFLEVPKATKPWNKDRGIQSVDLHVSIVALLVSSILANQKACFTRLSVMKLTIALRILPLISDSFRAGVARVFLELYWSAKYV